MNTLILRTRPERLTAFMFSILHADATLRDAYNRRWNLALF